MGLIQQRGLGLGTIEKILFFTALSFFDIAGSLYVNK